MKESIIEKLNNHIFKFSDEERTLLTSTPEIFSIFIRILNNNQELYNQNATDIKDIIENINSEDIIYDLLDSNITFYFLEYLLLQDNKIADDESLNYCKEEQRETYLKELRQKLLNNELDFENSYTIPEYFLRIVLEEKKYEVFDYFKKIPSLPDDLIIKLNEYIETTDDLPSMFGEYCENMELPYSKYPIDKLFDKYENLFDDKELAKALVEKIKKAKTINVENAISLKLFQDAGYDINDTIQKNQIYSLLIDKKVISSYINSMNPEEFLKYKDRIISIIMSKETEINFSYISNHIANDLDLLKAFIQSGRCDIAVENNYFYEFVNNNFDESINGIIEYFKSKYNDYYKTSNILNILVKNERFNDYIYEYLKTHVENVCFLESYIVNSKILERAVNENEVDLFKRFMLFLSLKYNDLDKKIFDYLIYHLNNDSEFNKNFLTANKVYIVDNKELSEYFLAYNEESAKAILESYNHLEEDQVKYTKYVYDHTKEYLCKEYNITNISHLDYLAEHFGYDIVRYISNDSILQLINLPDEEFNKIVALFDGEYSFTEATTLFDSLKQLEFSKSHPEIINIFANVKHSIEDKSNDYINLLQISHYIDDRFYKKNPHLIEAKGREHEYLISIAKKIIEGNLSEEEEKQYYDIIHTFTNYYIAQNREQYRSTYRFESECFIPSEYDEKDLRDSFIKHKLLIEHRNEIINRLCSVCNIDISEASDIISYYVFKTINNIRYYNQEEKDKYENNIKSKTRFLIKIINDYIKEKDIKITTDFSGVHSVKRNYNYGSDKRVNKILAELNIEQIRKNLLASEKQKEYDLLLSIMKKYKLHLMPTYFEYLIQRLDLSSDITNIARFVNYFYKIVELEKRNAIKKGLDPNKIAFNAIGVLKNAEVFSSVSSVYSQVLGPEDSKLIKLNPSPNAASGMKSLDRLEQASTQTIKNFERTKVHVPCFNEIISFKSKDKIKKIRVVVGNFTHPSNLTHGERTGACMRIGGVGFSLFDFCLNNEYGFHIRFEDPETKEYISRVSGFRNGNTVFLNELRESCNPELFTSEEVVEACRVASELLVGRSKESQLPIDNVFVHRAYATQNDTTLPVINFKGKNIKKGLPHFYSDISSYGLLLASSKTPNKDISLSTELPEYLPAREIPYEGNDFNKISNMVNRINIIKQIMNGVDKALIEPIIEEDTDIKYGIVSQDYYIFVDKDNVIHEDIIETDNRAIEELNQARIKIKEYLSKKHLPSLDGLNQEEEKAIEIQISQQPVIIEDISEQEGQIHR